MSEADKKAADKPSFDVAAELSREMTVVYTRVFDKTLTRTPVTLTGLHLISEQGLLSTFYLPKCQTDGWGRLVTRVKRAVDRYSDLITRVDLLVTAAAWLNGTIETLEMRSLNVAVVHHMPFLYDEASKLYEFRLPVGISPTPQNPSRLFTPSDLREAIQSREHQAVENMIAAGVDVNSIFTRSMLTEALAVTIATRSIGPVLLAISTSIFNLIASQPDVDWDLRSADGNTMLQQTLFADVCSVQHLLPWDKIDLYACNDLGENIMHSCCKYDSDSDEQDRIVTLVKLLLRLGAQGLVLGVNDDGKRPSEVGGWPVLLTLLGQAEVEASHIVSACLSRVIAVDALTGIIMSYYTTFS